VDKAATAITYGQNLAIRVSAYLNGLIPEDVTVECLLGKLSDHEEFKVYERLLLNPEQIKDEHGHLFCLEMRPNLAGLQYYELRMYPRHRLLCHPFEMGLMVWL
jgi:starch phosphorylase